MEVLDSADEVLRVAMVLEEGNQLGAVDRVKGLGDVDEGEVESAAAVVGLSSRICKEKRWSRHPRLGRNPAWTSQRIISLRIIRRSEAILDLTW